jgi:hypothetical protein
MTRGSARGAPGGREPSNRGDEWRPVTKRDNGHFRETAGQRPFGAGQEGRPQQDSNLRSRLRKRWITYFEFVHLACLDSMAHLPSRRDHSAHIPDHGYFRRD